MSVSTEPKRARRSKEAMQLGGKSMDELIKSYNEHNQKIQMITVELQGRFKGLDASLATQLLSSYAPMLSPMVQAVRPQLQPQRLQTEVLGALSPAPAHSGVDTVSQDSYVMPLNPEQTELDSKLNHLQGTIANKINQINQLSQRQLEQRTADEGVSPF